MIISASWKRLITEVILLSEKIQLSSGAFNANLIHGHQNTNDVYSYFAPEIFIWDPVSASQEKEVLCPDHGTV